jgi:hypothetical protein
MMTFFTPPCRCARAFSAFVKCPVLSLTIWVPTSSQGISLGSGCANTSIRLPSISRSLPSTTTVPLKRPYVES